MEIIASILSSIALSASFFGIFYLRRRTKEVNSIHGIFGVIICAFAMWHFFTPEKTIPIDDSIISVFVIITTWINTFFTKSSRINIGVDRRKVQLDVYDSPVDRRAKSSNQIINK